MAKKPEVASAPPAPKKEEAKPEPVEAEEEGEDSGDKFNASGSLQEALRELGAEAERKDVLDYIHKKYGKKEGDPGFKNITSALSTARKKVRGGDDGDESAPKTSKTTSNNNGPVTFDEVEKARNLCVTEKMAPEKLLALLEEAEKFGDIARLKKCLAHAPKLK